MEPSGYSIEAQLERTVLSWNRVSLAVAANGGLVTRWGFEQSLTLVAVGGLAVIGVGAAIWTLSIARYRPARNRRATHLVAQRERAALALVLLVVVLSLAHLVLLTRDSVNSLPSPTRCTPASMCVA